MPAARPPITSDGGRAAKARKHRAAVARVSDQEYAALLELQGGTCALCPSRPKSRRLHVDHEHSGELAVRGLLCHRCNRALPAWVTPAWLRAAATYLEKGHRHDDV